MARTTNAPFGEAVAQLMAERGLSYRQLSQRTIEHDTDPPDGKKPGLSHTTLQGLVGGVMGRRVEPSPRAITLVASVLGVSPSYFLEHRLRLERDSLDPTIVGIDAASDNLNRRSGATRARGTTQRTPRRRPQAAS